MELCDLPAYELSRLFHQHKASAVEILDSTLKRIQRVDGRPGTLEPGEITPEDKKKLHAFITVTAERARSNARQVDEKFARGDDPGPLAGVPFSVKDIFTVRDTRTTIGSRILENFIAPYTATAVERMEQAGAVMVGKVNLDEFAFGSSSESSAFQPAPRNPWDLSRVPGGSSGGSVASVAAGEAALSIGTDTAGSIRQPAAFSGVVGLKPTYGRVSRYGLIASASSLDCTGLMGRNVSDVALSLGVIAGADPYDATTVTTPVPDYVEEIEVGVKGLRIGLSPDYFKITYPDPNTGKYIQQPIPAEFEETIRMAAQKLADMGAEIVDDVPMPNTRYGIPAYFVVSRVEKASNLHRFDGVKYGHRTAQHVDNLEELYKKSRGEGFGLQPKLRILMGMYVSAAQYSAQYYQRALRVRALIRRDFEAAFDPKGDYRLDALLTPTTPTPAFPIGEIYGDTVLMQYADQMTVPANHAGVPAISVPAALSQAGLPIGLHIIARDFDESTLLRVARAYEIASADDAWRRVKPEILRDLAG
jgi:aspartyl-tRNA(Asn)/glutamyl-tRNA(Gln) amidotransferase subunit A